MSRKNLLSPRFLAGVLAVAMVALAVPAYAQLGSLKGKVVDEAGAPVADADVAFDYVGEMNYKFTAKTDKNGEWTRAGLQAIGRWNITIKKGNLIHVERNVEVPLSASKTLPTWTMRPATASGAPAGSAEAAKANAENKKLLDEINVALAAKNYDDAIAKLTTYTTKTPSCAACYTRLGDAYFQKKQMTEALAAYNKAIETDANAAEAYEGLATLYNDSKKFDEAAKASAKAAELRAASGGGDAMSFYNTGVIFYNQTKMAEARAQFEKAVAMNPTMADARYYLGMTLINEGKLPEARKELEEYVKLAPTGSHAQEAKDMIPLLK